MVGRELEKTFFKKCLCWVWKVEQEFSRGKERKTKNFEPLLWIRYIDNLIFSTHKTYQMFFYYSSFYVVKKKKDEAICSRLHSE